MRAFNTLIITGLLMSSLLVTQDAASAELIVKEQDVTIVTNAPGFFRSPPRIVLTWPALDEVTQYNIYRKTSPLGEYPDEPLNGATPISIMTDCDDIKAVMYPGSYEWEILATGLGTEAADFDPCAISEIPRDSTDFERLQILVRGVWKIAIVAGQGYNDEKVTNGTTYYYELRGIIGKQEEVLATDITITAGVPIPTAAPTGLEAIAGDSKVLILWDEVEGAAGYNVYRATSAGTYQRVNDTSFMAEVAFDFDGNDISPAKPGFVDFQRWDSYGNPESHDVNGHAITGPEDGEEYFYQVVGVDLFGQEGTLSAEIASATPTDQTPPMAPGEVTVSANDAENQLEVRWAKVSYDTDGHDEPSIQGYRVYRYEIPDSTDAVQVNGLISHPAGWYHLRDGV